MYTKWQADQVNQPRNLCFNAVRAYVNDGEPMSGHMDHYHSEQDEQQTTPPTVHTLAILYTVRVTAQ